MTCNIEGNAGKPEMLRRATTVLNLFPMSENPGEVSDQNNTKMLKPMKFPETAGFHVFKEEELPKRADTCYAAEELQTAQMTIFYGGQVFVFNDFPADKVKEVILLAGKGNGQSCKTFPFSTESDIVTKPVEACGLSPPNGSPNFCKDLKQFCIQTPSQPIVSAVLPIARKASLQRFLEKRKDRVTARAPYQTSNSKAGLSKLPVENNSWLGLA